MSETAGMQGSNVVDREAPALCGYLVPGGSVYALLAEHRQRLFPTELFADLFPSGAADRRSGRGDRGGDGAR